MDEPIREALKREDARAIAAVSERLALLKIRIRKAILDASKADLI